MLLFLFLLQFFALDHDFVMANFEVNQEKEGLTLAIKMDKENLENLFYKQEGKKIELTVEDGFIQNYLDEHFYLLVNDQKINFTLQEISTNEYFYKLKLSSQFQPKEVIRHIQLKNTCLIEEVYNHSNIVNFQVNGKYRTFRLHKGRVRIAVDY